MTYIYLNLAQVEMQKYRIIYQVNLLSEIGVNADKVGITSFSQGFGWSIKSANELQKAYPDLDLTILANDGYGDIHMLDDPL